MIREENVRRQLPPDGHMWRECPKCSSNIYRVNNAAAECRDCKAPRPADARTWTSPEFRDGNGQKRILSKKAKAKVRRQMELGQQRQRQEQLQRQHDQRRYRHPRYQHGAADLWSTDDDNAWANWRPSNQRNSWTEDETVQNSNYPWRNSYSSGASLARAGGHLAPFIFGTIMCDMINPAEVAGAHETGAAAFAMMLLAYV